MNELSKNELMQINGGGLSWATLFGLVSAGLFIIGAIDGYLRPYACR